MRESVAAGKKKVIKGQQKHINFDHIPNVEVQWPG